MPLSRLVPSVLAIMLTIGFATATPARAQVNVGSGVIIDDVVLEGVELVDGVLTATGGTVTGTIAGLPFTTDITNFALELIPDAAPGAACTILDLELGPIDLDLLGLHVDTSPICLTLTALEGEGLLGDLLCDLAGGLDLGGLNLDDFLAGLTGILSTALTESMAQEAGPSGPGAEDICDGGCEVLDLALGPVDLTLLGLNVLLDDCEGGPVQVCVSASAGEGLLGDLLCGLAGGGTLLDLGALEDLVGTILDAIGDADLTPRQVRRLANKLISQAAELLQDGALSNADVAKLTKTILKVLG